MKARLSLYAFLAAGLFACGKHHETKTSSELFVRLPKKLLATNAGLKRSFNPDHKQDDTYAFGFMSAGTLADLSLENRDQVTVLDQRYAVLPFDAKTLDLSDDGLVNWEDRFAGYHNYAELTTELTALADAHPDITQLSSAGKSVEGRELWLMKLSDHAADDEAEPKLLFIANMHGDEVVGRELMIYLIRKLLSEYPTNPKIARLLNHAQVYIMPSMNPDGFERSQRANADDFDLNRNFPDFVDGPENTIAGRQIETQHIMALHAKHHFVLALNFHGGALCVNLPWDTKENDDLEQRFGDDALIASLGHEFSETHGVMASTGGFDRGVTYGYEWYRVSGGMQDFANVYGESTHATVELSMDKWPPANSLETYWRQNEHALVQFLERGTRGIHLNVTDTNGELLDNVSIRVSSASRRQMVFKTGLVNRPTLAGAQRVWVSAPGFMEKGFDAHATDFDGTRVNVKLEAN